MFLPPAIPGHYRMACPSLITCGDNVKIWDSNGYSLLHQFQPNNTKGIETYDAFCLYVLHE